MAEKDGGGERAGDGGGARRAPPEAQPVLPGIPEPEPAELPAPASLPVGEPPGDTAGEGSPSRAQELEGRLDHRLEVGLDRRTERETEQRLEGEIDQAIDSRLRRELELQIDGEVGRQMQHPRPPGVVDLAAREEIPYATVLPEREPAGPRPKAAPARGKKVALHAALRNRQPRAKTPAAEGRGAVNGRGMVNGRGAINGLRNHRGISNGMFNGEGAVNGRGAVNGLRNRRGISNGMFNGEGAVNGRGAVDGLRNRRGLSNGEGTTNGNGLVNGRRRGRAGRGFRANGALTDAEARTNGRGMVNGRGIVNGEGMTNGRAAALGEAPPRPRRSALTVIAAAVIAIMLMVAGLYFLLSATEKGIHVDGLFSDWGGVPRLPDDLADQANPEINIVSYALSVDGSSASLYLKTEGKALGGRNGGVDTVYWFFDTDQETATGYRIDSVGAELVLVVDGYDGRVTAAGLYRFPRDAGRPANDWNSRQATGACRAASAGSELEAQAPLADLGVGAGARFNVLAYARDSSGGEDYAPVLGTEKVRLTVLWSRVGPEKADPGASGVPLLQVELGAAGGNASVSSLTVTASGALADGDIVRLHARSAAGYDLPGAVAALAGGRASLTFSPPLAVAAGGTATVTLLATFSAAATTGRAVGLGIADGRDIAAGTRAITVESGAVPLTYIGAATGRLTIDGAFLDWEARTEHADPRGDVADPNIDVVGFRTAAEPGSLFTCLRVDGQMMGGLGIPERKLRPPANQQGGGGGPATLPVLVGEDSAFIFFDADNDSSTGYSGGGLPLGADYMANFTGQYGRIAHRTLHRFSGSDRATWTWTALGDVDAAIDATRLEARLALDRMGSPAGNLSLFYYTTNWRLDRDAGQKVVLDLAAGPGGRAAGGDGPTAGAPETPVSGRDIRPLLAPEFRDVLLPMAGLAAIILVLRRRRRLPGAPPERANGLLTR